MGFLQAIVEEFLGTIPALRATLATDVPAGRSVATQRCSVEAVFAPPSTRSPNPLRQLDVCDN